MILLTLQNAVRLNLGEYSRVQERSLLLETLTDFVSGECDLSQRPVFRVPLSKQHQGLFQCDLSVADLMN